MNTLPISARSSLVMAAVMALLGHWAPTQASVTDDALRKVHSYGNVSIAQDSVTRWGPWEEFEPPAAGATDLAGVPAVLRDPYRPLPPVNPPEAEGPCGASSYCGFAAFINTSIWADAQLKLALPFDSEDEGIDIPGFGTNGESHHQPFPVLLTGSIVTPQGEQPVEYTSRFPDQIQIQTTNLVSGDPAFLYPSSGELVRHGSGRTWGHYMDHSLEVGDTGVYSGFYSFQVSLQDHLKLDAAVEDTHLAFVYGHYKEAYVRQAMAAYISGSESMGDGESVEARVTLQKLWGVMGLTSSQADMDALKAGRTMATYNGRDLYHTGVSLAVDFGNATWSGNWESGGFTASGAVSGVNFAAKQIASTVGRQVDAERSFIQGAFFGPQAAAVGGVADVTSYATTAPNTAQPATVIPVQRYVAPFMAVRTDNSNK